MKFFVCFCLILSLSSKTLATGICGREVNKSVNLLHREHIYRQAFKGLAQDVYVTFPKDVSFCLKKFLKDHVFLTIVIFFFKSDNTTKAEVVDMCVKDHDPNVFGAKPVFAYSSEDDLDRYTPRVTIILRGQESRAINSTVEFYGFILGKNNK